MWFGEDGFLVAELFWHKTIQNYGLRDSGVGVSGLSHLVR